MKHICDHAIAACKDVKCCTALEHFNCEHLKLWCPVVKTTVCCVPVGGSEVPDVPTDSVTCYKLLVAAVANIDDSIAIAKNEVTCLRHRIETWELQKKRIQDVLDEVKTRI